MAFVFNSYMNVKELEMMSSSTVCLAVHFIVVFPTQMTSNVELSFFSVSLNKEVFVCVCVGGGGGGGIQKHIWALKSKSS